MGNQEHLDILKQGAEAWNAWRKEHPEVQPDLCGIIDKLAYTDTDLSRTNLAGIDLSGAELVSINLTGADLTGANLYGTWLGSCNLNNAKLKRARMDDAHLDRASLIEADLSYADLSFADLTRTDLSRANLSYADLTLANLSGADLSGARLKKTDLRDATVNCTKFASVDLREVKGLMELRHTGASIVQLHSVQLPHDVSTLHFLRSTGVPDAWIDDYCIHVMRPLTPTMQYPSVFISFASADEAIAKRLYADLQHEGIHCWFAPEDLKIGDHYHHRIEESILRCEKLILILSEQAVQSAWVEREVVTAREKEDREQRPVLFPLRLDDEVMHTTKAWAADVRRRWHIGDFTQWKNYDAYQKAFERLLRDLKQEAIHDTIESDVNKDQYHNNSREIQSL